MSSFIFWCFSSEWCGEKAFLWSCPELVSVTRGPAAGTPCPGGVPICAGHCCGAAESDGGNCHLASLSCRKPLFSSGCSLLGVPPSALVTSGDDWNLNDRMRLCVHENVVCGEGSSLHSWLFAKWAKHQNGR